MRARKSAGAIIAFGMIAVGLLGVIWGNVQEFSPESVGKLFVLVGVILACFAKLMVRTSSSLETQRFHYDRGLDDGYELASKEIRPTLVSLDSRRCPSCREGDTEEIPTGPRLVDHV